MTLGEFLILLGQRGFEFRVSEQGEYAYLREKATGATHPLPNASFSDEVAPELIEWAAGVTGVSPSLDLQQDPPPED